MDYSILSRSYDLRGIYGVDIDDDFFYRLGYAFVKVIGKERIALGYDARNSSYALMSAFISGANRAGGTIINIGRCSSDMLSFATCHYDDIEAGVMITASHNPKEYNGMKSLAHSGEPYNLKKYGPEIILVMNEMREYRATKNGTVEYRDILEDWTNHIIQFAGKDVDFSKYSIVADGGSGVAGVFMEHLANKARFTLIPLFLEPDGNFPYHHPNPMLAKNREDARKAVIENTADIALIFDGDADRVILLDENGHQINSAIISSVIAYYIMKNEASAKFIGNAVTSHNFRDFIEDSGSQYIREKVGHVYIRETMMCDKDIAYAGEHSAHYFFRDNYYMDSGIIAAMVFLGVLSRSGKKASEFIKEYVRFITLEETNFRFEDPVGMIKKLEEKYKYEKYDLYDGITVEYSDGSWWNFRPSSNEPLLRFNLEARTQERFDALYNEIYMLLENNGAKLVDE